MKVTKQGISSAMQAGDELVICCPTSPNDGKRVRVVSAGERGYNPSTDMFEPGFVEVEVLENGVIGGIHKRFLTPVQ